MIPQLKEKSKPFLQKGPAMAVGLQYILDIEKKE